MLALELVPPGWQGFEGRGISMTERTVGGDSLAVGGLGFGFGWVW